MPTPAAQLSEVANAAQAVLGLAEEMRAEPGIHSELANRLHVEVTRLIYATRRLGRTMRDSRSLEQFGHEPPPVP